MFLTNSFIYRSLNLFNNLIYNDYRSINFYFLTDNTHFFLFFCKNISKYNLFLINYSNIFVKQIKLPLFSNFKKLNLQRNFVFYKKYLFKHNFKFTKILTYSLWLNLKKITKSSPFLSMKTTNSLPFSPIFIKNLLRILLKPWHYLSGKSVSSYNWDLFNNKNIFKITNSSIFIKNNHYFKNLSTDNPATFRKFYINNFFYYNTYKINYSNLFYLIKLTSNKRLKNQRNLFFVKPYFFLNNHDNVRISKFYLNNSTIGIYRNYLKFFSTFRRYLYSNKIKKNYGSFFKNNATLNNLFFSKYIAQLNPNFINKRFNLYRNFSFFIDKKRKLILYNQLICLKNKKKKLINIWANLFIYKNFKNKCLKKNSLFTNFSPLLNKYVFELNSYFLTAIRYKYAKHIKKIFIFSFFYKNSAISSHLYDFKSKNITFIENDKSTVFNNHVKSNYRSLFLSHFCKNFISLFNTNVKKKKISKNKIPNKILFYSKEKTNFLLSFNGFLFTNNFLSTKCVTKFTYNLKKAFFSFSRKNEMQRFILKRYAKINFVTTFITDNRSPKTTSFKPLSDTSLLTFYLKKNNNAFFILNQNLFNTPSWDYLNNQINAFKHNYNDNSNFVIKRTKFKPGYMTIWREARNVLKTTLSLKFKYQYKLTNYLFKYKKFINFKTFLINEFKLINIIIQSKILLDEQIIQMFLYNNLLYVNGRNVFNKNIQLFVGDFVQLLISIKYYILFKWFLNLSFKKKIKLKKIAKKKFSYSHDTEEKKKSYSLPKSILFNKYFFEDVINYLEVDYFTLSVIILYEPLLWTDLNNFNLFEQKFSIINLYNWKYIT